MEPVKGGFGRFLIRINVLIVLYRPFPSTSSLGSCRLVVDAEVAKDD